MNLQEFISPLPKPWLNITANSLTTLINITTGPSSTNSGTGTLNITPANLVNGLIGATGAGTLTIQLPTAAAINTYLSDSEFDIVTGESFKFTICVSAATTVHFLLGSNMNGFDAASPLVVAASGQKDLIFVKSSSNWVIYY